MGTSGSVRDAVRGRGEVFATFDAQDSGHLSYGVRDAEGHRWFVKTAHDPAALDAEVAVRRDVRHRALRPLVEVVEATDGVAVVLPWYGGTLLRSPSALRGAPDAPMVRFRAQPLPTLLSALDDLLDLHVALEAAGWIAGDLYDGSLMHEADTGRLVVVDLECYRRGAYVNEVGRLPGSSRFMAPEEHVRGAAVTPRTTVFTLGRCLSELLPAERRSAALAAVVAHATRPDPSDRPPSVAALQRAWRSAL